ncbi:macrolide-specific efflux protein MacA [Thermosulfidibacter takaii ABI70S6]|uniref:Macrolide-specific efflux protein MacA n=1 Tax=Thermosulfidibacter takaii (strain DSM 17441 / JCM 13301 / NBRC 103674 / ABI70S6) TaxID=1298851 RepID=A0A0S3QV04_THET7|nr:efflux RND transporter periplasmic adaptor subunit [Thermosulfidibacter takaii]BAT72168.1 macrolide-specific efflux protein MacA [Thermosulfidibacter takaii ABI70S6]
MKRISFLFLVLTLVSIGCSRGKKSEFVPKGEVKVKRGDIVLEVTATGTVKAQVGAQVKVGARISGKVERLFVQEGDEVKKGQLIAVIEHKDLKANMLAKKYAMEAAESKLRQIEETYPLKIETQKKKVREAEAEFSLAQVTYQRIVALYKDGLASKQQIDEAYRDLSVKKNRLLAEKKVLEQLEREYNRQREIALRDYEAAKKEYEKAKVVYGYAFIYSPISGVVSSVSTQQGETVVAGLNAPTFITVIDLSRLQVDAYVDETDIGKVKPGQKATFVVDAYPDKVFEGVVSAVYPGAIIRNNVVFYDTKIDIKTPYVGLLKPSMTADVTIIAGTKHNVLVVPAAAVKVGIDGKSYVMLKKKGKWVKTPVKTGWESQGKVEILEGLKEGDVVALW